MNYAIFVLIILDEILNILGTGIGPWHYLPQPGQQDGPRCHVWNNWFHVIPPYRMTCFQCKEEYSAIVYYGPVPLGAVYLPDCNAWKTRDAVSIQYPDLESAEDVPKKVPLPPMVHTVQYNIVGGKCARIKYRKAIGGRWLPKPFRCDDIKQWRSRISKGFINGWKTKPFPPDHGVVRNTVRFRQELEENCRDVRTMPHKNMLYMMKCFDCTNQLLNGYLAVVYIRTAPMAAAIVGTCRTPVLERSISIVQTETHLEVGVQFLQDTDTCIMRGYRMVDGGIVEGQETECSVPHQSILSRKEQLMSTFGYVNGWKSKLDHAIVHLVTTPSSVMSVLIPPSPSSVQTVTVYRGGDAVQAEGAVVSADGGPLNDGPTSQKLQQPIVPSEQQLPQPQQQPLSLPQQPIPPPQQPLTTPQQPIPPSQQPFLTPQTPIPLPHHPLPTPQKPIPPSQQPLPTPQKPIPPSQQPLPTPRQPIPPSQQPLPTSQQPIPPPQQPLPTPQQPIPPPQQPLPIPQQPIPPLQQPLSTPHQTTPPSQQLLLPPQQPIPPPQQLLPPPQQPIPLSQQLLPPPQQPIPPSQQLLPPPQQPLPTIKQTELVLVGEGVVEVAIMPGDGHCLFSTLLHQLKLSKPEDMGHKEAVLQLRRQVVFYVKTQLETSNVLWKEQLADSVEANPNRYPALDINGNNIPIDNRIEAFLTNLEVDEWGGTETIVAVSHLYDVVIVTYFESAHDKHGKIAIYPEVKTKNEIAVVYRLGTLGTKGARVSRVHYDSFIRFVKNLS